MKPFTLNIRGNLLRVERPMIMGIINVTPDSFWEGSRAADADSIAGRAAAMIADGVDIIDLGACSTRPGAETCDAATEEARIAVGIEAVRSVSADIPLSVDTFRASVARSAVEHGADIVNDISGGDLDPEMMPTVASLHVPYIMMHMRGTPATMQSMCDYPEGVVTEVVADLSRKIERFRLAGVADIIADPGLGFAKTVGQNYELLRATAEIEDLLGTPVLIGLSRKSMLTRPLGITAAEALEATTAANTLALVNGAAILRVHDVKAAVEAREIVSLTYPTPA